MEFSFGSLGLARPEPALLAATLGERAHALEARAEARGLAGRRPEELALRFRAAALAPAELARLRACAALRIAETADGALDLLAGARAELERLARDEPGLAPLLAAHDAALAPPARGIAMGVVNVTPDSFSDGGRTLAPQAAIEHGLELVRQGALLLDVGGESTRPGASGVSAETELERVLPVVEGLVRRTDVPVGVDTTKAAVAEACLSRGARLVNDVSAGRADPRMLGLVAERGAGIVLMHMRGTPRTMQDAPHYADVVREVLAFLRERAARAREAGIAPERIALDPGFGFGKRLEDNLALLRALPELRSLGLPLAIGVSRKSFLGRLSGTAEPADRLAETVAASALAAALGAEIHRVHDVGPVLRALSVAHGFGLDPS